MVIGKCTHVFRGIYFVWGELRGGGFVGRSFLGGISQGEEKFNEKGAGISSITIKKTMKK